MPLKNLRQRYCKVCGKRGDQIIKPRICDSGEIICNKCYMKEYNKNDNNDEHRTSNICCYNIYPKSSY